MDLEWKVCAERHSSSDSAVSIGVIGAGKTSCAVHLPVLSELARQGLVRCAAVCDLDCNAAKAAAAQFGFAEWTHDADDILADTGIDAVYVFGTAQMHFEYGSKALQGGKHVFLEKPPAPCAKTLQEMLETAINQRVALFVGFNRRWHSTILQVKNDVTGLSVIRGMELTFHKPCLNVPARYGATSWLQGNGIHAVDLMCFMMDSVPSFMSACAMCAEGTTPQIFSGRFSWDDSAQAVLSSNNAAGSREERYTFHASGLSYVCEDTELLLSSSGITRSMSFADSPSPRGFLAEHREFLKEAAGSGTYDTARGGIAALHLVELMEQSYQGEIDWSLLEQSATPECSKHRIQLAPPRTNSQSEIRGNGQQQNRLVTSPKPDESVLILNPSTLRHVLPRIARKYRIVYPETFEREDKSSIVGVITGRGNKADIHEYIEGLPNLRVAGIVGNSVKRYAAAALLERQVKILNAAEVYADTVAEYCVMLAILGRRRAIQCHETMKKGGWGLDGQNGRIWAPILSTVRGTPALHQLARRVKRLMRVNAGPPSRSSGRGGNNTFRGSTIGLVGFGPIANKFIEKLAPFGCSIKVYSDYLSPTDAARIGVQKCELAAALSCDIVSIHRGISDRTRNSIGQRELELLKSGAVLVNTANGTVVNEQALIQRLRKKDIFAFLDVFENEPLPKGNKLRRMPNVFLTSHISGSVQQMYSDAAAYVAKSFMEYLESGICDDLSSVDSVERLQNMT